MGNVRPTRFQAVSRPHCECPQFKMTHWSIDSAARVDVLSARSNARVFGSEWKTTLIGQIVDRLGSSEIHNHRNDDFWSSSAVSVRAL